MKTIIGALAAAALIAGGVVAAAYATPPTGGPPGQEECEHGNSGRECKPDPQPEHGKDCEEHGPYEGGVNEDHCLPEETTPTDTNPPGGGHTPVTICHKPGTPAEQTLVVDDDAVEGHLGHGDTLGACPQPPPVDYCDTLPGVQAEDEDCPGPPPVDVCPNVPGVQTEGPCETTVTPPPPPGPPHVCPDGGPPNAGKDGQVPGSGNTNDDCDRSVPPPPPVTTTTAAPPTATTPAPTVTSSTPPVTVPPTAAPAKPKAAAKPKPDNPPVIVKVEKKPNGVVKITTSDGKTHTGVMGSG